MRIIDLLAAIVIFLFFWQIAPQLVPYITNNAFVQLIVIGYNVYFAALISFLWLASRFV